MDVNRLNTGEKLAGASGIALLLIMFIFDWFTVDVGGGFADISVGGNAWETMELIRFILLLAAFAGIALAIAAASQSQVDLPVALSAITAGLGILAVVLVIFRIISPPDGGADEFGVDIGRGIGVFLGLIAAGGVAAGGWMAMQEEGASFSELAQRRRRPATAGPTAGPTAAPRPRPSRQPPRGKPPGTECATAAFGRPFRVLTPGVGQLARRPVRPSR